MHPIHKSGAAKRKEHKIRERKKIDEVSKIPKLDTYFNRGLDGEFSAKSLPVSASDEFSGASNHIASSSKTEITGLVTPQSKSIVDQESGVVHGKEGYRRYCQTSFFTRVHPLTGKRVN